MATKSNAAVKVETTEQGSAPEAPPDLEKLRQPYIAGVLAVQRNDGAEAVRQLSSFDFGPRAVEEYRLYYLARGQEQRGEQQERRSVHGRKGSSETFISENPMPTAPLVDAERMTA